MFNTIITPNDNDEYALYEIYLKTHTHRTQNKNIYGKENKRSRRKCVRI